MGLDELASVIGPTGAVLLYMWINRGEGKKADPMAELSKTVAEMNGRLIKIETIVDRIEGGK